MMKLFLVFVFQFCFVFKFIDSSCPNGTLSFASQCYQFITDNTVFVEAEYFCQQNGGHLVSILDGFTNSFIAQNANRSFVSPDFWVGGEDLDQRGKWVWTDKSAFTYANWAPNEPDLLPSYQCISVTPTNSFWYTSPCGNEKPFICAIPASDSPSTPRPPTLPTPTQILQSTPAPTLMITTTEESIDTTTEEFIITTTSRGPPIYSCDGGWSQYNDTHFCFKISPNNVFDDAEFGCKSYGGHLASIHSAEELHFIDGLLSNYFYWVGLCSTDNGNTWTWTDGTPTDYSNWCSNGPQHLAESCAVISPQQNCLTNVHKTQFTQAICKKPANVSYGT